MRERRNLTVKMWQAVQNVTLALAMGGVIMAGTAVGAYPIRTPEGNMPMVHWAVLEATPGNMQVMSAIAAKTVGPQTAGESGTYALYGGIDETDHDLMRLLEIYESYEAYRIHTTSEAFQEYRAARLPLLKSLRILEVNGIALEQKKSGTATVVLMHRHEVKPEKLAEYQHLAKDEAVRAVHEDDGVMGMFVTAEHERPNIIHTMELYRDRASYEKYVASGKFLEFQGSVSAMFVNSRTIKNIETKIFLSEKAFR